MRRVCGSRGTDGVAGWNFVRRVLRAGGEIGWGRVFVFKLIGGLFCFVTIANCQTVTTFAGTGSNVYGGNGVPATSASFADPRYVFFDKADNCYVADGLSSHRIRKIDVTGIITTIAGNGLGGFSGDGIAATASKLNQPVAIITDTVGNLYIADAQNNRVRKVDVVTGVITTIAGTGAAGFAGDTGPATAAMLKSPVDICFDRMGNLYIADQANFRIRKVNISGIITTFAGSGGSTPIGDGGAATAALLNVPSGLAIDDTGNVYIADQSTCRVRKVNLAGIITTVAGNGNSLYSGDNIPATDAQLSPSRIRFDKLGQLHIVDGANRRIFYIDNVGILHHIAGTGINTFNGDGLVATATNLYQPNEIAFDACGSLYISDNGHYRIRKVQLPAVLTNPTIALSSSISNAPVGTSVIINATVTNAGGSYIIHWQNRGIEFTTTTVPSVTYTKAAGTDTITARVVSTATYGCYDSTTSAGWVVTASGVGLSAEIKITEISMWPNPVNDELHFEDVAGLSSYCITNMVGTVLLRGELGVGHNVVRVGDLPAGVYMVEVMSSEGLRVVKKVVKQ